VSQAVIEEGARATSLMLFQVEEIPMTLDSMSEDETLRMANPIMDNLMDTSTAIDHERHTRDFSARMKAIVTKEDLQKICEKYQQEKGYFSPASLSLYSNGEFVAEMLLIEQDGKFLVDHAMVF
jgi:hypothetical protein